MQRKLETLLMAVVLFISSTATGLSQRRASTPDTIRLPDGTNFQVRLTQRLDSDRNQTGDRFEAMADKDVMVDGRMEIPVGSSVAGRLVEVRDAGKVKGRARMALTLTEARMGDAVFPITTNTIVVEADDSKRKDAGVIGGSAAIGAIIGAIAGGGKGAAVGAIIGAAGGTGVVLMTEGKDVEFEPEQKFNFILEGNPRTIRASQGDSRRPGESRREDERFRAGRSSDQRFGDQNVPAIARELSNKAENMATMVRTRRDDRRGSPAISGELNRAFGDFASSARRFANRAADLREESLRRDARNLISQAERLDGMIHNSATASHLRQDWAPVQHEVARVASALGLSYSGSGAASSDAAPRERDLGRDRDVGRSRGYFRWQGRVDGTDYIRLQGDQVAIQHVEHAFIAEASHELRSPLPREAVTVRLAKIRGRGRVELTEQPSAANNYTAVVLIEDPEGADDTYIFELTW